MVKKLKYKFPEMPEILNAGVKKSSKSLVAVPVSLAGAERHVVSNERYLMHVLSSTPAPV